MEQIRETFVEWLRDAHAAERQALTMLNSQAERIESFPALKARIEQHIQETEAQLQAVDGLLKRYSTGSSTIKDITGRAMAFAQGVSGMLAFDEVVKGGLFGYAFEHMEIASYRILITTARRLGDSDAVDILTTILEQEEAMAGWLLENMDSVVNEYLTRVSEDVEASR